MNKNLSTLSQLLTSLNLEFNNIDTVTIDGCDPILPSPFLIGQAGAIALAGVGYLASELWYLKTTHRQKVSISVRDAALAQRSHQYMRLLDRDNDALWDPLSGFYETKDSRWIQFHCNFPHHKEGILRILNCKDSKEAVIKATKKFDAAFLEQTLQTSGMCAAMVRTVDEWQNHPQYQALKDLAIIEITKLQNSEPIKLQEGQAPLSNIKVIDLTRVIAGPICTRTLAEHGADVTLVTSPHLPNIMPLVIEMGHGKKSIHLDLNQEGDCKKLRVLVEDCDIFCQSYRPGGLDAKGFSPQYLSKLNPHLIYVSVDAYSHVGPWSSYHGFDTLVQSATGIAWEQGNENAPQHLPAQTLDYVTGYFGALGAMEALRRRTIEGGELSCACVPG